MRTRTQVFDGGDFVEVPTGSLCMHSTACGDAYIATQRPLEPIFAASGPGGVHRPTSRFRHTYERYSNRMKKIWQYCQFSYRLIIPPNRSTGKCRRGKINKHCRRKRRYQQSPMEQEPPALGEFRGSSPNANT